MGRKRKPASKSQPSRGSARSASLLQARRRGDAWELVHPRCALDRAADLEEVQKMIEADELEVARDELLWLLSGCSDCVLAHKMLGEIALLERDLPLARGHFGYGYQLGIKAFDRTSDDGPMPYRLPANQTFHESGKGLAYSLRELGKRDLAQEVIERLLECDPSDPLGVRGMLSEPSASEAPTNDMPASSLPVIELPIIELPQE